MMKYEYFKEYRQYIDGSYAPRMKENGWEENGSCNCYPLGWLYLWRRKRKIKTQKTKIK